MIPWRWCARWAHGRLTFLALMLAPPLLLAGCGNLFAPSGCTQAIVVTDSVKIFQGADTTLHVDTLARFKLCAQ